MQYIYTTKRVLCAGFVRSSAIYLYDKKGFVRSSAIYLHHKTGFVRSNAVYLQDKKVLCAQMRFTFCEEGAECALWI
jgi:hypothetical protein